MPPVCWDTTTERNKESMRNIDRIKGMERQAAAMRETIRRQRQELEALRKGVAEVSRAADSVLAALAERYGEAEQEEGKTLGWRLLCPIDSVAQALEHMEVRCRRDEKQGMYIIGAVHRQSGK